MKIVFCPLCSEITKSKHTVLTYEYFCCNSCKTLFIHPLPSAKNLNKYYQKNFVYSAGATNEMIIRKRAKIIIKNLLKLNPEGSKLLDIGSGYGFFLDEAYKKGLKITGIEPSQKLFERNSKKMLIINDHFPSIKLLNKKFDFITLIHVIEHVSNPSEIVQHALSLLNPKGILYIETPNFDSHLYRFEKENYTFLTPPDHLWVFSQYSFINIIPKQYQLFKISTYSYPEHFMGIVKEIFKKNDHFPQRSHIFVSNQISNTNTLNNLIKSFKYIIFDLFIARLLYRSINLYQYGSILELYIKKK